MLTHERQSYLQDPTPTVRGMVIQAIRFTFADSDDAFDEVLKPMLIKMLTTMLNDPNIENRRLALSTLNSATANKSAIVLPHLAQLIPLVMKESRTNTDLIREVQMGPFKHKVDDGLELRKVKGFFCTKCMRALTSSSECVRDLVLANGERVHTPQPPRSLRSCHRRGGGRA